MNKCDFCNFSRPGCQYKCIAPIHWRKDACQHAERLMVTNLLNKQSNLEIEQSKAEIERLRKERDAAIADLTELCMFYKTQTICNFCAYDSDEECKGRGGDNGYTNKCFKWRGPA